MSDDANDVLLEGSVLEPMLSVYIMGGGAAADQIAIDWVRISNRRATARCRFLAYFRSPTDGSTFHLSAQRGIDFITQVACIQALYLNDRKEKSVEMWLNDYSLTCVRAVRDPDDIRVTVELIGRTETPPGGRRRGPRSFYKWRYEVGDMDWFGVMTASFGFADNIRV